MFSKALLPAGALVTRFYASSTSIDNKKDGDELVTRSNPPQENSTDKV